MFALVNETIGVFHVRLHLTADEQWLGFDQAESRIDGHSNNHLTIINQRHCQCAFSNFDDWAHSELDVQYGAPVNGGKLTLLQLKDECRQ